MTTIIQTTPWGVCQRYYDERGVLLYSAYVARPSAKPGPAHHCRSNQLRHSRWNRAWLPIPVNLAAERKNLSQSVELVGA